MLFYKLNKYSKLAILNPSKNIYFTKVIQYKNLIGGVQLDKDMINKMQEDINKEYEKRIRK